MMNEKIIMHTTSDISGQDMVEALTVNYDYDEIIEFIQNIEKRIADWEFTKKLIKLSNKFEKELKEEEEEYCNE